MKWPRGRYNGQRIVGVDIHVIVDVCWWTWCLPNRWGRCLGMGPLRVWVSAAYRDNAAPSPPGVDA